MSGSPNTTYPVHEVFSTFQGEGTHMGQPAFFIRLYGCPVKCPWCDSAGTWHPNYVPKHVTRMGTRSLVQLAEDSGMPNAVITGGEPCIHDLTYLARELDLYGIAVHLETSGAFPIKGIEYICWTVLSPKKWKIPIKASVEAANEFKLIIEEPEDITLYSEMLHDLGLPDKHQQWPIWLHPEWSQRDRMDIKQAIVKAVCEGNGNFRAGYQLHKLYQADAMDPRARELVPLGGNPEKGY